MPIPWAVLLDLGYIPSDRFLSRVNKLDYTSVLQFVFTLSDDDTLRMNGADI
jgi:hypothetical protein